MSSFTTISPDKLVRLIGTARSPALIDVRTDKDFAADPRLIPGAVRRKHEEAANWGSEFAGQSAVVVCQRGEKLAQGTAAWLRHTNADAETLEGGFEAWKASKLPLVPADKLPPRDAKGRTVWVTRARPKIDRIACPWLIRRFVDPGAVFLFVAPSEVAAVGERFSAAPFDIENVFWSHRGELHLRRHGGGVWACNPANVAAGEDGAWRRHRAARSLSGSAGAARRLARSVAHVR
jgi:rhodanese-related sulfurtransferase